MAVAFDNVLQKQFQGSSVSTVTKSYTTSGTNRLLLLGFCLNAGGPISTLTYAGVAMTQVGTDGNSGFYDVQLWALLNPASGANNIVVTLANSQSNWQWLGASYTGVIGFPDGTQTNNVTAATSVSGTVTPGNNNDWLVGFFRNEVTNFAAGASTTLRSTADPMVWMDNNAAINPAAPTTISGTWAGSGTATATVVAISPTAIVIPSKGNFLTFM